MLDLEELKELHDKAYNHNQVTRDRASDDLVFYWVTQWDDNMLDSSQLAYRGEFNILRKAGRQILSDLEASPVQVDFDPKGEDRDDAADLIDGLYRQDARANISQEAFSNAELEAVVCGYGAWVLYTDYETIDAEDNRQIIRRRPIYEANNTCYWDQNARLLDKSDADYCSVLWAYSKEGYEQLHEDLTGEETECDPENFKEPNSSYSFPWLSGEDEKVYVVEFYHREKKDVKHLVMTDPVGDEITVRESDLSEVMDEMIDAGFEIIEEKKITRWVVTKYIASGERILETKEIAGQHIPVVPAYGEHAHIEGEEHWEGITRLAKDPQRLRNFQMSYLADIVSRSPRIKPIFWQEQVAGFEHMYEESGAENNYPYYLQNRFDGANNELPIGPIQVMPEQPIPNALVQSIALSREAVEDVANPGIPQDIADPDMSGKAAYAMMNRIDQQSYVYHQHMKHAKRRDGEIYASMAKDVYDAPRTVTTTLPDGSRKKVEIMQTVIDSETGEFVTINDITNVEFDVYSDIGPSYTTKREQTIDRLNQMSAGLTPGDPLRNALILKTAALIDGVDFSDIREYAKKQLLLAGIREPENEEEAQMLAQAQQSNNEPSAEMVLAMAEDKKGQADLMREQREMMRLKLDAMDKGKKHQVDAFEAQTDRINTQIEAQKVGADINYKRADTFGKALENQEKMLALVNPANMSDDDLWKELLTGTG